MKIKKFEKYDMDIENGMISDEYAKLIISKFIDDHLHVEDISLEDVFIEIIRKDQLDENQASTIKRDMIYYLRNLLEETKKIRHIYEIDAEKYNL